MKRSIPSILAGMVVFSMIFLVGCQEDNQVKPDNTISAAAVTVPDKAAAPQTLTTPAAPTNPSTVPALPTKPVQPADTEVWTKVENPGVIGPNKSLPVPAPNKPAAPRIPTTPGAPTNPSTAPTVPAKPVQPADTGGRIKVENPVFDLGVIGPNKSHTAKFKFSNIGSGKLIISQVQTTCSCSVPDLAKLEYAAGESGVVSVTYHSSAYAGPVEKHLYILSNDSTNPRVDISIKGSTELAVVAEPMRMQLFLNKDNAGAVPITLKSKDGKPFAVQSITCSGNVVAADFDPKVEKTEFSLQPKVDLKALKGSPTGNISIRLSHPDCDSIALVYEAVAIYTISQPRIILQNVEPGQTVTREVYIKNNYNKEFSIASVTCQNNTMKIASQEKQGSSIKLMIEIIVPPQTNAARRYLTDKLDIKTSDGELLTINCSGWYKM